MARRSDHSPAQLRALFLESGHGLMTERGFAGFSAREAARRAGYSVGSIYHVFGSLDAYIVAVNTVTLARFAAALGNAMAACPSDEDRLGCLVGGYFAFASENIHAWSAVYDHRRPVDVAPGEEEVAERVKLTTLVDREVAAALNQEIDADTRRLARSLIATVHGHCAMALTGNFALMNEHDPVGQAVSRVRESIAAHRRASAARSA